MKFSKYNRPTLFGPTFGSSQNYLMNNTHCFICFSRTNVAFFLVSGSRIRNLGLSLVFVPISLWIFKFLGHKIGNHDHLGFSCLSLWILWNMIEQLCLTPYSLKVHSERPNERSILFLKDRCCFLVFQATNLKFVTFLAFCVY